VTGANASQDRLEIAPDERIEGISTARHVITGKEHSVVDPRSCRACSKEPTERQVRKPTPRRCRVEHERRVNHGYVRRARPCRKGCSAAEDITTHDLAADEAVVNTRTGPLVLEFDEYDGCVGH
jgi:hypothetical protein